MDEARPRSEVVRTTLAVLFVALLIGSSLWVLRPFLPALIWATMLVVATWPLLKLVQAAARGSRAFAVTVMTVSAFVVFAIPVLLAITTIAGHAPDLISWSESAAPELTGSTPPAWLDEIPLVGKGLAERWKETVDLPREELAQRLSPYVKPAIRWFLAQVGGLGLLVLNVLLTGILAAVLYARGEEVAETLRAFARRLAGPRGDRAVRLAGQAIRGVALGVVGTALIQSALAWLGVALAGVPYAGLLTAVMFLCSVAQIGPTPVLLGCIAWLWWQGNVTTTVVFGVWSLFVATIDNVLRPLLIRRGADLPLLLIFAGVIGGIVAFGVIGIFIGPMLLAVGYTLLLDWIHEAPQEREGETVAAPAPSDAASRSA
jgi:predicted PurR-regulated permease PerM